MILKRNDGTQISVGDINETSKDEKSKVEMSKVETSKVVI